MSRDVSSDEIKLRFAMLFNEESPLKTRDLPSRPHIKQGCLPFKFYCLPLSLTGDLKPCLS